jgi:diguanylate cyclase (GGDEF)-like protein/PAS domain S-box-containing protein
MNDNERAPAVAAAVSGAGPLSEIGAALSAATGVRFFRELVSGLCRVLGMDYAFVGEPAPSRPDVIRTLAFCNRGRFVGDVDFRLLPGTPYGDTACREMCYFPDGARKLFPEDDFLYRHGVEAFVGHPLHDAGGNLLGLLAVMHEQPVRDVPSLQAVLGFCAGRTAAELERTRALAALRASEKRFQALARVAPVGIFRTDAGGDCLYINERWCEIAGLTPEEARGSGWARAIHPEDRDRIFRRWYEYAQSDDLFREEYRMQRPDGAVSWVLAQAAAERDAQGRVLGYVGSVTDITARARARARAEAELRKLSSAVQHTADAVLIADRDGTIEYVNPALEAMTGYSRAELVGKNLDVFRSDVQDEAFYRRLRGTLLAGETFSDVLVNRRKDGSLYYEEKLINPIKDAGGNVTHFVATGRDITERMAAQERLQRLAHHDTLTGLPNRALFLDRLRQALARARRHGRRVAILFLDLDDFKRINDAHGHEAGDRFLQGVAERLRTAVRESDTVARYGGDEFAFVVDELAQGADLAMVVSKIQEAFAAPIVLSEGEFPVRASVGVSLYPDDGTDADTLLKRADAAMYRAKGAGEGGVRFHPPL